MIGAVSLALRALVLRDLLANDPLLRAPALDDAYYLQMARRMAEGAADPWFLAPLHPWLAARLSGLFELNVALLCGMNAVTGALTSVAIALCARQLRPGWSGWVAGALHALLGAFVFHDVLPGQEPLLALLHVLAALAGIRLARGASSVSAAGLGALTGIAVLGRGTSLALLLCALPALRLADRRRRTRIVGACAAGLVLALLPAAIRNVEVQGSPSPLPWSGGANLYLANGPDARATVSFYAGELGDDPWTIEARSMQIAAAASGAELTPAQASTWWRGRALDELGSAREFVAHQLRKAVLFWSHEERGSNHAADVEKDFSFWLRVPPFGAGTGLFWLLPWALAVWWDRRRERPEYDAVAFPVLGTWLLLTVFFPVARYRLAVLALGAVLAGTSVPVTRRARPASLALFALGLALAWLPVRDVDPGTAHVNVAAAHMRLGDADAVVEERLRLALAAAPQSGPAHEMLGRLLLMRAYRDPSAARRLADEAFPHLLAAAQDRRTRFSAQVAALAAMALTGRTQNGMTAARGLLEEQPDHLELLANAAWVAWAADDRGRAAALLAQARRLATRTSTPVEPQIDVVARFTGL